MFVNPYSTINWESILRFPALTHEHCAVQQTVNNMEIGNIKLMAVSNYYPAKPMYPLSDYFTLDDDVLSVPNAEHRDTYLGAKAHFNGLGSTWESGAPRGEIVAQTSWQTLFSSIFENLLYQDGGGVTLNHPVWSGHTTSLLENMLDYDERVLGIEIYNQSCEDLEGNGWAINVWDEILLTGRKCWGFAVPDHGAETSANFKGRIILLLDSFTEQNALKAIRNGQFYSQLKNNSNLYFSNISYEAGILTVSANGADSIEIVVDGESETFSGNSVSKFIGNNIKYARIKAYTDEDMIFSNPIIIEKETNNKRKQDFIPFFCD